MRRRWRTVGTCPYCGSAIREAADTWEQQVSEIFDSLNAGLSWPEIAAERGIRVHSLYRRLLRHQEHELIEDMLAKVHPSPASGRNW